MKYQTAGKGDDIVVQGESAEELMVVIEGTCMISVDGHVVRKIHKLDLFGERALIPDKGSHVRGATVTAVTDVKLMTLSRKDYEKLLSKGIISSNHHQRAVDLMNKHMRRDTLRGQALTQVSSKNGRQMTKVMPVCGEKADEHRETIIAAKNAWLALSNG